LLKALGRLGEALAIRREQARAEPRSVVAHHNLASLLGDLGRNVEAVEAARRAIANGGQAPETWLVLARALSAASRHDEAAEAFGCALARRPASLAAVRGRSQPIGTRGADRGETTALDLTALEAARCYAGPLQCLAVALKYAGVEPPEA